MRIEILSLRGILFIAAIILVSSCSVTTEEYREETPVLDMSDYFNGQLNAWGMFQDYRGKVIKRFHVEMVGTWEGNTGTLDEHFTYTDGSKQRRIWTLNKLDKNNFTGTANDVVGIARGTAQGNALRWRYTLALETDDGVYDVQFDDWMYMIDDNTVINRSIMQKFGINVGEVTLVFHRGNKQNKPLNNPPPNNRIRSDVIDNYLYSGGS